MINKQSPSEFEKALHSDEPTIPLYIDGVILYDENTTAPSQETPAKKAKDRKKGENDFLFSTNREDWVMLPRHLVRYIIPLRIDNINDTQYVRAIVELKAPSLDNTEAFCLYLLLRQAFANEWKLSEKRNAQLVNLWRNSTLRNQTPVWLSGFLPPHPAGDDSKLLTEILSGDGRPSSILLCSHLSCCAGCSTDCPRVSIDTPCRSKDQPCPSIIPARCP